LPDATFGTATLVGAVLAVTALAAPSFVEGSLALTALTGKADALSEAFVATFVAGFAAVFAGAAWVGTVDLLGEADFIDSLTDCAAVFTAAFTTDLTAGLGEDLGAGLTLDLANTELALELDFAVGLTAALGLGDAAAMFFLMPTDRVMSVLFLYGMCRVARACPTNAWAA
jgi:hypothetical protein